MRGLRSTATMLLALALALLLSVGVVGTSAAAPIAPLEDTTWRVIELSIDGATTTVPDSVVSTLRLSGGEATGSGACNAFFGPYVTSGSELSFGPIGSTRLVCAEPGGSIEAAYFEMFASVASYAIDETSLSLLDASGNVLARYAPLDVPTVVGVWSVTGFAGADGGLTTPLGDAQLSMILAPDGTVEGSSGCNRFAGSYVASDDGTITFGPLAATGAFCSEEIMSQESAFLAALAASVTWARAGDMLGFRDAATEPTVTLQDVNRPGVSGRLGRDRHCGWDRRDRPGHRTRPRDHLPRRQQRDGIDRLQPDVRSVQRGPRRDCHRPDRDHIHRVPK